MGEAHFKGIEQARARGRGHGGGQGMGEAKGWGGRVRRRSRSIMRKCHESVIQLCIFSTLPPSFAGTRTLWRSTSVRSSSHTPTHS